MMVEAAWAAVSLYMAVTCVTLRTSYIAESISLSSLLLVSWLCSARAVTNANRSSSVLFSCFMLCSAVMYLSLKAVRVRFA
jgi:hypothetical protein